MWPWLRVVVALTASIASIQVALGNLMDANEIGSGSGMDPLEPNSTDSVQPFPSFTSTVSPFSSSSPIVTTSISQLVVTMSTQRQSVLLITSQTALLSSAINPTPTSSSGTASIETTPTLSSVTTSIETTPTLSLSPTLREIQSTTVIPSSSLASTQSSTIFLTSSPAVQSSVSTQISSASVQSSSVTLESSRTSGGGSSTVQLPSNVTLSTDDITVRSTSVSDVILVMTTPPPVTMTTPTPVTMTTPTPVAVTTPTPVTVTMFTSTMAPVSPTTVWDTIGNWFQRQEPGFLAGIFGGGGVVLVLSIIILCFCCRCICARARKKRQRNYGVFDTGLTVTNTGAASMYTNGAVHYRQNMRASQLSLRNMDPAHYELNQSQQDTEENFPGPQTWDTQATELVEEVPVHTEDGGYHHSQARQLSMNDEDIFEKRTLPELTPIPSQLFASSSLHQGLSVDEGSVTSVPHRLSLSGEYLPPRLPGGSPSLRHVTRMGQSIANEDTKSAQGSRLSIPGSKTSMHGSRPSVFSSQTSFLQSGSRSQMFSPVLSTDPMTSGNHRDDDSLSLPLSGRATSPLLQQSSLNSSIEVPTRDEPSTRVLPLAMSHDLGTGVKDFASMTCISNHSALSAELNSPTSPPLDFDSKFDTSGSVPHKSLSTRDLGALTTISGRKSSTASEPADPKEREKEEEKPIEDDSEKKNKSKMSRLEMLTSLRASMRKAAMRMSFNKGKKKKTPSAAAAKDSTASSDQEATPTRDKSSCRHSDNSNDPFSPVDPRGGGRQRAYTDFPQLSQPNLYYPPQPYHILGYPQLSQSYGFPPAPPPMQVPLDNPFGRNGPHPPLPPPQEYSTHHSGMVTPDYSDLTTPEHSRYGNQNRVTTPESFLQRDVSPSDDYPQSTSPNRFQRATSPATSSHSNDIQSPGHERYRDTSTTSDPYRAHSPIGYGGKPLPTVHERYHFEGYHDDYPGMDMFSAAPPYSNDVFMSPRRQGEGAEYPGGVYPLPPMSSYPGGMHNGFPGPYFDVTRRTSFENSYDRDDAFGNFPKRRGSYDRTGETFHHPRQGSYEQRGAADMFHLRQSSYEQAPGEFPHPRHHPRHGSRDSEQDGFLSHSTNVEKRHSKLSDVSSDLSASRTRVSWNMEVIEHIRTPSDGSDFDLNQL